MSILTLLKTEEQALVATLKADGKAVEQWALSEADKLLAWVGQQPGLGTLIGAGIDIMKNDTSGLTGAQKLEKVALSAVPYIVSVLSAGQSALPIIETDIVNLARAAVQKFWNDGTQNASFGSIVTALGL
jgi:hypothetical protein